MTLDLSIAIVSYNAEAYLAECLASIPAGAGDLTYEVIVVDNGSVDRSVERIRAEHPSVRLIENRRNVGFSVATNQALGESRGHYCLWLNPDTVVRPGSLERLVAFAKAHPRVGVCGPRVLNRDGTLQKQCRRSAPTPWVMFTYAVGLSRLFPKSRVFGRYLMEHEDDRREHPVDSVSGAALLVRREALTQVGGLDEDFFAYGEDLDFCFRARKAGWEVYFCSEAEIVHYGGRGGSSHRPWRAIYEFHRAMLVYYRKHLAAEYMPPVNWLVYAGVAARGVLAVSLNALRREKLAGSKKP